MRLTKDQRDRLVLTAGITVAAMGLCYQFLVRGSLGAMKQAQAAVLKAQKRLDDASKVLESSPGLDARFRERMEQLMRREEGMAPATDPYGWSDRLMRDFAKDKSVVIREVRPPEAKGVEMFPSFPYAAVTFSVRGVADYWQLGSFVAEFENEHPWFCVRDLVLTATAGESEAGRSGAGGGVSLVNFQFSVVALTRPKSI